jgi:hypothetical protein
MPNRTYELGATANVFRGNWTSGTAYKVGDLVVYSGKVYICKINVTGSIDPVSDTTNWAVFVSDGAKGDKGDKGNDGIHGTNGLNTAIVHLYCRSSSSPSSPTGNVTYTFASGVATGLTNNWTQDIPDNTNANTLYVTTATAVGAGATDTILPSEWASVKVLVSDGSNSALVYAYKRVATAPTDNPGTVSYSFTSNAITTSSLSNNWSKTIPEGSNPLYVIIATASSNTDTDEIAANEWATPVKLVQDGVNGINGTNGTNGVDGTNGIGVSSIVTYYKISNSNTVAPTGTWNTSTVSPTVSNPYLWSYSRITYTNNSTYDTAKVVIGNHAAGLTDAYAIHITDAQIDFNATSGNPTSTGLWLGNNKLGYYYKHATDSNQSDWKTYMDQQGNFYLKGSGTNKLEWSSSTSTLTVVGEVTAASGTIGGWTLGASSITGTTSSSIKGGQTAYNTGTGFFLGYDGDAYKFSIGSDTNYLRWDGSSLTILGNLTTTSIVTASSGQRIEINKDSSNEIQFYGDRGNGTIEKLASIGIGQGYYGTGDSVVLNMGSFNTGHTLIQGQYNNVKGGVLLINWATGAGLARSIGKIGENNVDNQYANACFAALSYTNGISGAAKDVGVYGYSSENYGGLFSCHSSNGKSPLRISPSASSSAPTHTAAIGSLWVTSAGVLYINTSGSTTWQKVGAQ